MVGAVIGRMRLKTKSLFSPIDGHLSKCHAYKLCNRNQLWYIISEWWENDRQTSTGPHRICMGKQLTALFFFSFRSVFFLSCFHLSNVRSVNKTQKKLTGELEKNWYSITAIKAYRCIKVKQNFCQRGSFLWNLIRISIRLVLGFHAFQMAVNKRLTTYTKFIVIPLEHWHNIHHIYNLVSVFKYKTIYADIYLTFILILSLFKWNGIVNWFYLCF